VVLARPGSTRMCPPFRASDGKGGARQAADLLGGRYRGYPLSEYCSQSASMCFCCLRIKILISGARGKSGKVLEDM
jgi:hypothetical protein